MLDLLDGEGFHAKYALGPLKFDQLLSPEDFVYLPMDFRNGRGLQLESI